MLSKWSLEWEAEIRVLPKINRLVLVSTERSYMLKQTCLSIFDILVGSYTKGLRGFCYSKMSKLLLIFSTPLEKISAMLSLKKLTWSIGPFCAYSVEYACVTYPENIEAEWMKISRIKKLLKIQTNVWTK